MSLAPNPITQTWPQSQQAWTQFGTNLNQWLQYNKLATSVKAIGAKGNGTTNDTAAVQAAINAGGIVYFPPGNYLVDELTIDNTVTLVGAGRQSSILTSASGNAIAVGTDDPFYMNGLQIVGPNSASAGRLIQVEGTNGIGSHNSFSIIRDCQFKAGYSQLYTVAASSLVIDSCYFTNFVQSGVHIENQWNVDAGDSTILGCTFANSPNTTTSSCIEQFSSGGLKVFGNKLNTGAYGYRMVLASGAVTSDLLLNANSIENAAIAAIAFSTSGAGTFTGIDIQGNQIAIVPVCILLGASGPAFSFININGNNLNLYSVAASNAIGVNYASAINISGNIFSSDYTGQTGILVDANSSGNIGDNTYTTYYSTKINNGSGAVFVLPQAIISNSHAVTCSGAQGSLYFGTASVSFPATFDSAPSVECDPGTVTGGVCAWASGISASGFTLNCLSTTNGGNGAANYRARGVI